MSLKSFLLFLVTLLSAFIGGSFLRGDNPKEAVSTIDRDAQLTPLEKLHREIDRRQQASQTPHIDGQMRTRTLELNRARTSYDAQRPDTLTTAEESSPTAELTTVSLTPAKRKLKPKANKAACAPRHCRSIEQRKAHLAEHASDLAP